MVLITGVSGFLGSQCCLYFLKNGTFRVRGTVRDPNNALKVQPLKDAFGELYNQLELVKADLTDAQSLTNACVGCTYVVHTASPVPTNAKNNNEKDVIRPAVDGTKAIMNAALANKVKRLVYTSSIAACYDNKDLGRLNFGP